MSSFPFAIKRLRASNRQDFVFIRPPGISHGALQLRMDNVWFCKVLLLFEIESKSDVLCVPYGKGDVVRVVERMNSYVVFI